MWYFDNFIPHRVCGLTPHSPDLPDASSYWTVVSDCVIGSFCASCEGKRTDSWNEKRNGNRTCDDGETSSETSIWNKTLYVCDEGIGCGNEMQNGNDCERKTYVRHINRVEHCLPIQNAPSGTEYPTPPPPSTHYHQMHSWWGRLSQFILALRTRPSPRRSFPSEHIAICWTGASKLKGGKQISLFQHGQEITNPSPLFV